jgi:ankyrin repeat protein
MNNQKLLDLHNDLGYQNSQGLCQGFAIRWLESILLGEEQLFKNRLQTISYTPKKILLNKIKKPSLYDREFLDIRAFFDSLTIFQAPDAHPFLFGNKYINQDELEIVSDIASSDKIRERGGLTSVYSECFLFCEKEISSYLHDLEQLLNSMEGKEPIGFLLSNKDHTIAIAYKPDEGWYYRDVNQDSVLSENDSSSGIAKRIMGGFSDDPSKPPPYSAFNIKLVLTRKDERINSLKETLQNFKTTHNITQETASRQTDENLVYVASMFGDIDLLKTLVAYGFDLNKKADGATPAFMAAQNGHAEALEVLAEQGADLDLAHQNGTTPTLIATQKGHTKALKVLATQGADLNQAGLNGATPALIAAQQGHVEALEVLAEYGADLNLPYLNGATPAYIAAQNGYAEALEVLAEYGADLNQARPVASTPALIAAQQGHVEVLEVLAEHGADLNQANKEGVTPVFVAAQNGHISSVEFLIEQNADLQLSFKITTADLKELAAGEEANVQTRINDFLIGNADDTLVELTPYHIAKIMGHDQIAASIETAIRQQIAEKIKQAANSYLNRKCKNATGTRGITRSSHWYRVESGAESACESSDTVNDNYQDLKRSL